MLPCSPRRARHGSAGPHRRRAAPLPPLPARLRAQALKVVAHIGRKGSADLRRLMARHSGAVRDLLHFRCDPDPFKGDTVWKRVQVGQCL